MTAVIILPHDQISFLSSSFTVIIIHPSPQERRHLFKFSRQNHKWKAKHTSWSYLDDKNS